MKWKQPVAIVIVILVLAGTLVSLSFGKDVRWPFYHFTISPQLLHMTDALAGKDRVYSVYEEDGTALGFTKASFIVSGDAESTRQSLIRYLLQQGGVSANFPDPFVGDKVDIAFCLGQEGISIIVEALSGKSTVTAFSSYNGECSDSTKAR